MPQVKEKSVMAQQKLDINLSTYIDATYFGERPHIRGRRVPVATVAYSARDNDWSVEELGYQYTLSEAEVLAALLYYSQHQAEIDAQEAAYQAKLDRAYEQFGERLDED
jgi:uncharacterized protein (DUF433 family)